MKPYKIYKNIETSENEVRPVHVDIDTVFVNKNVKALFNNDNIQIGCTIGTQEWYKKDEYIECISDKNEKLEEAMFELTMTVLNLE